MEKTENITPNPVEDAAQAAFKVGGLYQRDANGVDTLIECTKEAVPITTETPGTEKAAAKPVSKTSPKTTKKA